MKRILITGMSGAGKSSVIEELKRRGFDAIDTDSDAWCEWKTVAPTEQPQETEQDWVWREDKITELLKQERDAPLFVCGCKSNQGMFYPLFDSVVLLSCPTSVLLDRLAIRLTNDYGKSEEERARIIQHIEFVEPLLRTGCDVEFDTSTMSVQQLANELVKLAQA
jgi:broad-specificity NMP kinase